MLEAFGEIAEMIAKKLRENCGNCWKLAHMNSPSTRGHRTETWATFNYDRLAGVKELDSFPAGGPAISNFSGQIAIIKISKKMGFLEPTLLQVQCHNTSEDCRELSNRLWKYKYCLLCPPNKVAWKDTKRPSERRAGKLAGFTGYIEARAGATARS